MPDSNKSCRLQSTCSSWALSRRMRVMYLFEAMCLYNVWRSVKIPAPQSTSTKNGLAKRRGVLGVKTTKSFVSSPHKACVQATQRPWGPGQGPPARIVVFFLYMFPIFCLSCFVWFTKENMFVCLSFKLVLLICRLFAAYLSLICCSSLIIRLPKCQNQKAGSQ